MKFSHTLTVIIFLFLLQARAQQVSVVDAVTGLPVPSVAIYNKEKSRSVITGFEGLATLDVFKPTDRLYFQNISYTTQRLSMEQLIGQQYQVKLVPRSENMDAIVLSISKFEQRQKDVPQSIISVKADAIAFQNPQTSADLLQQTGQVFVQKSQQGGGSPLIRGFSTNRLLLTVDGVRMNNAIFRGGNVQNILSIDPLSVQRTEVILGPGSVVYGSDAIGGVMNFYTQTPQYASIDTTEFTGNGLVRYATANQEMTAHLDFNYGTPTFASATSISVNSFDDLRMGAHGPDDYLRNRYVITRNGEDIVVENKDPLVQRFTGYDQISLLQKFRYRPSTEWEFDLGLRYSTTSDYDRFDALNRFRESGTPRNASWYYGPQEWLMINAKARHRGSGVWYDKLLITQAYQKFNESRNTRAFQSNLFYENDEQVDVWSTAIDFERRNRENNVLFYGVEYLHNKVGSQGLLTNIDSGERSATASRYPDHSTWQSMAAYVSYQWEVANNLTLQSGARYNHIWLDARFDDLLYDFPFDTAHVNTGALTGGVGATYQPSQPWELRANLSTAFRAPNIDDIGKIFDPSPGTVMVPNPDLEAEYAYSAEIGLRRSFDNGLKIDIAGYYTYLKDALVARDFLLDGQSMIEYQGELRQVQAIQNSEKSQVYGVEVGMDYQWNDLWSFYGHYTWLNGSQETDGGSTFPVRHVAPPFGDLHILFTKDRYKLDAYANVNGQFDFEDLSPDQQQRDYLYAIDNNGNPYSPSWYTINLRSQYELYKNWSVIATLENITDQRYRTYSSGIAAAGRNLIIALRINF